MKKNLKFLKKAVPTFGRSMQLTKRIGLAASLVVLQLVGCGGGGSGNDSESTGSSTSPSASTPALTPTLVVTAPTITAQPANLTVIELQQASFSVAAAGGGSLTYQWKRNGTPIAGATSSTLTISSTLPADHNAKYSAVVTNSAGSVTSTEAVLTEELPMFLMAGQSNMEGNVDGPLFQQLLADLATPPNADMKARLKERIRYWHKDANGGYAGYGYSDKMADFEASELIRLNSAGLVGANLTTPNPNVLCAWNDSGIIQLTATPVDPRTRCSNTAGPELVFGQALSKAGYSTTSLIKVAYGGTSLYADWRSPLMGGTPSAKELYKKLNARIGSLKSDPASVNAACKTRNCKWSAFVWFQGEADADAPDSNDADRALYKENLKKFIANVRADAGLPNLPVVIVQIGAWAQSLKGNKGLVVSTAQTEMVNEDKYARIVKTDDLSGFYHYDPAAQFIIGERVSLAVKSLLAAAPAPK